MTLLHGSRGRRLLFYFFLRRDFEIKFKFKMLHDHSINQINNGFGPVFDERKSRELYTMFLMLCLICLFVVPSYFGFTTVFQTRCFVEDLTLVSMVISSLIIGEFLRRICFFYEEKFHIDTRHNGSFGLALYNCIAATNNLSVICITFVLTFAITVNYWLFSTNEILSLTIYATYAICSSIVMHLLKLKEPSLFENSYMNEIENKHLAAGLAWGFYFGYLKDQLPKLDGLIKNAVSPYFEIEGNDARDYLKPILYIIIPKDCNCTKSFENCDDRIMFQHTSIEDRRSVGGVQERSYKNSVYSISDKLPNGDIKKKYLLMEYATPIKNLYLMSKHAKTGLNDEDLKREVTLFYKKLKKILESDSLCSGLYKLILLGSTTAQKNNLVDILNKEIDDVNVP
ncbi:stimulator of interferon genes protein 1 isoform X3 [Hydra vulgaris]|uniref:Stimulator of interferon genes protein 1 isoform X3 n=1 Tax=Hydra vulgaris TaxID=6087 RepID=A0ABM4DJK4_HYDVU